MPDRAWLVCWSRGSIPRRAHASFDLVCVAGAEEGEARMQDWLLRTVHDMPPRQQWQPTPKPRAFLFRGETKRVGGHRGVVHRLQLRFPVLGGLRPAHCPGFGARAPSVRAAFSRAVPVPVVHRPAAEVIVLVKKKNRTSSWTFFATQI